MRIFQVMNGNNRKWSALFVLLIAVPAGFLTYLSARSFRSEQRAALSAINLLVPELQLQLDRLLANLATAALEHPITTPLTEGMQIPGVEFRFLLDERGALQYPRHLPLILTERSPGFAAAIEKAELLEFQEGDFEAAIDAYDKALNLAEHPREEAESLNGLARLRAAQGLLAEAREVHDQLRAHAVDLADADGAHPLSMSYVRLAGRLPPEEALAVLQEWVGGLLKGQ